jgi:hypothetical protein
MEGNGFDGAVRRLAGVTRRLALRAGVGLALGAIAGVGGTMVPAPYAEARKRRKRCRRGKARIAGRCAPKCGPGCTAAPGRCLLVAIGAGSQQFCTAIVDACVRTVCTAHDQCAANELCAQTDCGPNGGGQGRCMPFA